MPRRRAVGEAAESLGWFSIALGLAELLAPRAIARLTGLHGKEWLLRLFGLREIASGLGLVTVRHRGSWLWGRVGGDAIDLATLLGALGRRNPHRLRTVLAIAAVTGVTALDVRCARAQERHEEHRTRRRLDYTDRRGFAQTPDAMRGAARSYTVPADMRTPEPLRPYEVG